MIEKQCVTQHLVKKKKRRNQEKRRVHHKTNIFFNFKLISEIETVFPVTHYEFFIKLLRCFIILNNYFVCSVFSLGGSNLALAYSCSPERSLHISLNRITNSSPLGSQTIIVPLPFLLALIYTV